MNAPDPLFPALSPDFCAIFEQDMEALYSLALLLTADDAMAELCFLAALDDCLQALDVFPEWGQSWSKRAIVKQAIRYVNPRPDSDEGSFRVTNDELCKASDDLLGRLTQLSPFDRFVFAMTVLEGYSVHECAVLLGSGARDVERARVRALRFVAATDLQPAPVIGGSQRDQVPIASIGVA